MRADQLLPALLSSTIMMISIFGLSCSRKADPDEAVIKHLKKAGSDVSKPHKVEFFIYFPNKDIAEQAAKRVRAQGFEAQVQKAASGESWLCFATKTMVPDPSALQDIRRDFEKLADSLNGEYDGWGTSIEQ